MSSSYLVLEDGSVFEGEQFGHLCDSFGEVVFSTGMCGYQESLTDPSYRGQILIMTYPLIGNYGISEEYYQSKMIHVRGLVVREHCTEPSPMYGGRTLDDFLKFNKVPGISGIDTRDLVIRIRTKGTLKGMIVNDRDSIEECIKMLSSAKAPSETNLVAEVSCSSIEHHRFGRDAHVGLLDCGGKSGIMRDLSERFNVTVFPYDTKCDEILENKVQGLLISNGPGDPAHPDVLRTTVRTVDELSSRMPLFGICFGSQILGLAMGGSTYKMKFGHRGCNQPVKFNGKVYITSQNHGFAVDDTSLRDTEMLVEQTNVNDGTVEGIRHRDLPIFSSQYHPEASPGPWDTSFLFDRFARSIKEGRL